MLDECKLIEFPQKGDDRGHLVIVEGNRDIPFDIKRVFYIYGSERDVVRGKHANYDTEFVLINVAGTSKVCVQMGRMRRFLIWTGRILGFICLSLYGRICMTSQRIPYYCVLQVNIIMQRNTSETINSTLE